MARPCKLTAELRDQIAQAVSGGSSYRAAAQWAGVAESTLHSWLARGRAERDAPRTAAGEAPYVELLLALEQASARAEVRAASLITRASETDWRAAAWFLARRDPETWSAQVRVEHTEEPDRFDQLLEQATDEELALLQELAERHDRDDA